MMALSMGKVPPKKPERVKLKVVPPPRKRQDATGLLEALEGLAKAIEKHRAAVPKAVQAAMDEVLQELGGLDSLQRPPEEPEGHGLHTRHGRDAAGMHQMRSQRGERHDKKRAPAGFEYRNGMLWRRKVLCDPTPRTEAIAKSLLVSLGHLFHSGGAQVHLSPLLRGARGGMMMAESSLALEEAFEAIFGHRYGERERWSDSLVAQLEMDARHREEERLRTEHRDPRPDQHVAWKEVEARLGTIRKPDHSGAMFEPAHGAQIRSYLLAQGLDVPPDLTAEAIDKMRASVGINKGGPKRKKTARAVVDEFVQGLEKNKSSRKKAKR